MNGLNGSWNISTWPTWHLQPQDVQCNIICDYPAPPLTAYAGQNQDPMETGMRDRDCITTPWRVSWTVNFLPLPGRSSLLSKRLTGNFPCNGLILAVFMVGSECYVWLNGVFTLALIDNWSMVAIRVHQLSRNDCRLALLLSRRQGRCGWVLTWCGFDEVVSCLMDYVLTRWRRMIRCNEKLLSKAMAGSNSQRNLLMK